MTLQSSHFLSGGGVCGELIRAINWTSSPLGPPAQWPGSLNTTLGILVNSRHPMFLWWGDDLIQFYNDAYLPSFGAGKHPAAMGQRGIDCWQEIWPLIFPQIDDVMQRGTPSWNEDHLVPIFRNGRIEEVFWTYGYSPVYDEGRIAGTLVVCTETTARVVAERRLAFLRWLADALLSARDPANAVRVAADVLAKGAYDTPFSLVYAGGPAPIATGIGDVDAQAVDVALEGRLEHPLKLTLPVPVSTGPWPEPVEDVFVVPLEVSSGQAIVFGLSPRLSFDDQYRLFLKQIAEYVISACARVRALSERRNLLEQAPIATALLIGPDHVFEIANPRYREMVGRDVRGKAYLDAFPELRDTPLPGILDRVYKLGEPFVTNEMCVPLDRRGDGSVEECFFRFNLEPIRDTEGRVYGMMAIANEITHEVTARRALEATARAKDEFLATMSHELRTPLNAILGWARILVKDDSRDKAMVDRGLAVIERNAVTQARLVSDLLDVSRIVSGKLRLTLAPVDVARAIRAAIDVVRPSADAKLVNLVTNIAPDIGMTVADPDRIQQIVWNLLANAVRFTPTHGFVKVSASRDASMLCIEVEDTGVGIPSAHLPYIFERFRQVDATTTRGYGGLGLGLAIVRYLAEAHGGAATARSAGLGEGATFTVTLPVRTAHPSEEIPRVDFEAGGSTASPSKILLRNVRALIVDDDRDSLDLLREILESAGALVTEANSPDQALKAPGPFDIMISDIGMPEMDGYALLPKIRMQPSCANVPAIALTAFARVEDAEHARRVGYQQHMAKPVDVSELLEVVNTWVQRRGTGET